MYPWQKVKLIKYSLWAEGWKKYFTRQYIHNYTFTMFHENNNNNRNNKQHHIVFSFPFESRGPTNARILNTPLRKLTFSASGTTAVKPLAECQNSFCLLLHDADDVSHPRLVCRASER